eukprot:3487317-Pyramimonas_sp.AAC.1
MPWMGVKAREEDRPDVAPLLPYFRSLNFFAALAASFEPWLWMRSLPPPAAPNSPIPSPVDGIHV